MTSDIQDIRRHNLRALIKDNYANNRKQFSESTGVAYGTICAMTRDKKPQRIMDKSVAIIEESCDLEKGFLDKNRLPRQTTIAVVSKEIGTRKISEMHFTADGFELKAELRVGSEDEAELVRLVLRIIEIRSR